MPQTTTATPATPATPASPDIFDQLAKGQSPPSQSPQTQTTPQPADLGHKYVGPDLGSVAAMAPANGTGDVFDQLAAQQRTQTTQSTQQENPAAKHGLLRRAWDWVNTPVFDNILPKDIKTSDIFKAAAFEKMYNEAYIPGVNDFETKAQEHLGENPTKHAVRTFINGVAGDTASTASGFTSPVGIATTVAGIGPEAKAGSAAAKALKVVGPLAGTAFGLEGAHDIYSAGTENTPEAWQQRLQGAAMVAGGTAAATGLPEAVDTTRDVATRTAEGARGTVAKIKNVATGGQPKLQTAIRSAAETAAAKAEALGSHPDILTKQVQAPAELEDAYPVKLVYDEDGNVVDLDGRHRVIKAIDDGKEAIPVQVTLRDGTTSTVQQDPKVVADRFGVTKESLAATDENQPYRAGNLQPREPVTKPASVATPAEPTAAPAAPKTPGGIRTAIEEISNEVKAKSQKLYQQLDNESGGRWQRYEDQIKNLNDKLDEVNGIDDEAYDRLETKRNDIETSQAQMLEDLKEKGIDPKVADDAVAHYKQAMALRDLDKAVKGSTSGDVRVGMKETVDPKKFVTRVQKLYDSGRLEQALGKDGANALVKEAYAAKSAKSLQTVVKWTAGILAARYAGGSVLHNILTAASMVQ
jgi:hypothetical protein